MFEPLQTNEKTQILPWRRDLQHGEAISPIPDDIELDIPKHRLGKPNHVWDYKNADSAILMRVCRFIDADGKKEDRPLTYRKYPDGTCKWAFKSLDAPRPLYGLDRLANAPDKPVIICEGEKATDAVANMNPEYVAVSSPNGSGSPHKADWSALKGRTAIIWPDNDDAGRQYALSVARLLKKAEAQSIHIVSIPNHFPEKWDLADDLPDNVTIDDLNALITNAEEYLDPLDNLVAECKKDSGKAFETETLQALSLLKKQSKSEFESLRQKLKKVGVRVTELDKAMIEECSDILTIDEPDHLELARFVTDHYGYDNLISDKNNLWQWQDYGVWKALPDRALIQTVMHSLETLRESDNLPININRGLVDSVADVMKSDLFFSDHEWNINQDAINVLNGELHFNGNEWELKPHERNHYRTTQIPHEYDANADCSRFKKFLQEIFDGDSDADQKAQALLEMIGYTLLSHARLERFAILVGSGANGKSVVMEVIKALVGRDNVVAVQPNKFDSTFQRAHLHMKLANLVTEIPEGAVIADAELKAIVSGELTTAEHKNKDPFDFEPFATCWFGTNHMPHTRDFSEAIFRRALVIPFNNTFKEGVNADPNLKVKLLDELSGILNLALQAIGQVLKSGKFTEPQSCLDAKNEWRLEADQVAQFVEDKCTLSPSSQIESGALYDVYKRWADDNGRRHVSHKSFVQRLTKRGCQSVKTTNGKRMITGIEEDWSK
jgi:putative DNA primase/helicase